MESKAKVYLVGAGPGDPELLTVKALRLVQTADVVVYDRLVAKEILAQVPATAARICVGKAPGRHSVPQEQINRILVELAEPGKCIVRLKGGDPYVFGRGSEEALTLAQQGIEFEIVPGITAASAVAAYAGIPLTHRGLARSVRFLTGHFQAGDELAWDWPKLVDADTTLVIYMGLQRLPDICANLIAAGMSESMPAAAIQNGTTLRQRRVLSTLHDLVDDVVTAGMASPVLIVIGEVVGLAEMLDWFQPQLDALLGETVERYASA